MSRRNETVNRLHQSAGMLPLNKIGMRHLRRLIEQAYDAGKAHGTDLAAMTLGTPANSSPINNTRAAFELKNGSTR